MPTRRRVDGKRGFESGESPKPVWLLSVWEKNDLGPLLFYKH